MNLSNVKTEIPCFIRNKNGKENLISAALFAYELARKNSLKGNMTASSYACGIVLDDDTIYYGVNFNGTRNEISSICAERMAILNAFNQKVENYKQNKNFNYKIKYIVMANYVREGVFWSDRITPCADCLSWFNAGANFSSDTKIISLKKDENGEIYLNEESLASFLPLRNLSFEIPEENLKVDNKNLQKLYNAVLKTYKNNNFAKTSGQNIAAGVLLKDKIFTAAKIDYSKRWFTEPLEMAAVKAIEKFGADIKIEAVCYIGDEYTVTETGQKVKDGLVSIKTLGRLSTKFALPDTKIITVQNGKIKINTLEDFLPCKHKFIQKYKIH